MSIEAMKQALEAIANSGDFLFNWHDCEPNNEREMSRYQEVLAMNEKAFTALRTAIEQAEKREPVAWKHTMLDDVVVGHRPADLNVHPDRWMPLYKDLTPCKTCEALARTVMMDQTGRGA